MVPKASKLEMAKQFLREQAQKTQKILSTEIIELAAQEGISKRTLETAKKELKIKAERSEYHHMARMGQLRKRAEAVNEEAYERLDNIEETWLKKHMTGKKKTFME